MSVITAIKYQRSKKRVNIYLDGKFGFGLDLGTFIKYKLKVERELTESEIEKIVKESESQAVYDKLLKFASLRPRSEKEFQFWLKKHKVHMSLHEELFNRLKRLDFLNDKKFAVWWIEQRQSFRPKSTRVLRLELSQKGIDKRLIDEALEEVGVDEKYAAMKLLEKRSYIWKNLSGLAKRVKMSNYLAGHGYKWDIIKEVISEFDQK